MSELALDVLAHLVIYLTISIALTCIFSDKWGEFWKTFLSINVVIFATACLVALCLLSGAVLGWALERVFS